MSSLPTVLTVVFACDCLHCYACPPYWIQLVYAEPCSIIVLYVTVPVELVGTVTYSRTSTWRYQARHSIAFRLTSVSIEPPSFVIYKYKYVELQVYTKTWDKFFLFVGNGFKLYLLYPFNFLTYCFLPILSHNDADANLVTLSLSFWRGNYGCLFSIMALSLSTTSIFNLIWCCRVGSNKKIWKVFMYIRCT